MFFFFFFYLVLAVLELTLLARGSPGSASWVQGLRVCAMTGLELNTWLPAYWVSKSLSSTPLPLNSSFLKLRNDMCPTKFLGSENNCEGIVISSVCLFFEVLSVGQFPS